MRLIKETLLVSIYDDDELLLGHEHAPWRGNLALVGAHMQECFLSYQKRHSSYLGIHVVGMTSERNRRNMYKRINN